MSIRRAATLYEAPRSSLAHWLAGRTPCNEIKANYHKLTEVDEEVIVRYILDLDTRGFAPGFAGVEDMENYTRVAAREALGTLICTMPTRFKDAF
jgi:hypothetical protein